MRDLKNSHQVLPVYKTCLYLLGGLTYFYSLFVVSNEKIFVDDFLLLLIIFIYHLNFYEYTLFLQKGK